MRLGSSNVNTLGSRSRALLCSVTRCDQRFVPRREPCADLGERRVFFEVRVRARLVRAVRRAGVTGVQGNHARGRARGCPGGFWRACSRPGRGLRGVVRAAVRLSGGERVRGANPPRAAAREGCGRATRRACRREYGGAARCDGDRPRHLSRVPRRSTHDHLAARAGFARAEADGDAHSRRSDRGRQRAFLNDAPGQCELGVFERPPCVARDRTREPARAVRRAVSAPVRVLRNGLELPGNCGHATLASHGARAKT